MSIEKILKLSQGNQKLIEMLLKKQGEMNAALAKFRANVQAPKKQGHVDYGYGKGRVHYDYVTLDDLIASIDKGIKDTGLTWRQTSITKPIPVLKTNTNKYGKVLDQHKEQAEKIIISTIIKYKNGWEASGDKTCVTSATLDPQDIGSAITYAKRYSLATAFGINSDQDDDYSHQYHSKSTSGYSNNSQNNVNSNNRTATAKQAKYIFYLLNTKQSDGSSQFKWLVNNKAQVSSMPISHAKNAINYLQGLPNKQKSKSAKSSNSVNGSSSSKVPSANNKSVPF